MMTGTIVQTCVLFIIVYRTNWNREVNFFSHLFYAYVASNEILFNWNDDFKSVKPITHAILRIRLYTSEFELKLS